MDAIQPRHGVSRVRHELRLRELTVTRILQLTPHMRRVTLAGEALRGFHSAAADDHVKVFFPEAGQSRVKMPSGPPGVHSADGPRAVARDYTPRRYDAVALELDLDFVLHGEGPAASWAADAQVGHTLGIGGPRGSFIVSDDFDWYLLAGDETALPAIGRRLQELRADTQAMALIEIQDEAEQLPLTCAAPLQLQWLHRGLQPPGTDATLLQALRRWQPPVGEGYVWIAGESNVARAARAYLINERGMNKAWIKAAGYWKHGAVAAHETHND